MPPVIAAVKVFAVVGGSLLGAAGILGAPTLVAVGLGAAAVIGAGALAMKLIPAIGYSQPDNDKSRQSTVRGTIEPQKIIYGEALVSGPVVFVGVSGSENQDLHHVVALAGHECEAIGDIHLDSQVITSAQISATDVTSGTFGPQGGATICQIAKYLGTSTQAADSRLVAAFPAYTIAHQGRGVAYIRTTYTLTDDSAEVWDKYSPNNIMALVKGKKVYDPRLDATPGGSPANALYIAWSDNPALCVADFLMDSVRGPGIPAAKIDWPAVVTAANACDVLVAVPGGTQKRFTANGVLFTTDSHKASVNKILSAMNGSLTYTGGLYTVRAGIYEAPTESLDENDLAGPVSVKTSVERTDRFNTVGGVFIDPDQNHKTSEFPKVFTTAARLRDNGEILEREIELPFTNASYMAQRIANKLVQMSDQQKMVTFPANLAGLRVGVGDRVNLSLDDFGWSSKVFRCLGWSFTDNGGVNLTLAEDDAGSYADPAEIDYSTITADGVISDGFRGVPDPQNLAATAGLQSIALNWTNPANADRFNSIVVYASPTSAWSGAVEIGRGLMTSFVHDASTTADPITTGSTRYYWIRAIAYGAGTSAQAISDRNPDNDVGTISATAGAVTADSVEWVDVGDGGGLRPANNATVGAQLSVNLQDSGGSPLGDTEVLNSIVLQEVQKVELVDGDVLELIGGAQADIQNLGDVAVYAYNADQVLNGYINTLNTSVGNISASIGDITGGVGDVYLQATEPVAGVGGVPDPIVTGSRWYDSDDNNKPYYYSGSAWVSLEDPRIASNEAAITATNATLSTVQTTANNNVTNVSANASAISTLDSTVVALDGTVTALSGDYNAFKADLEAADPSGAATANAVAIDAIDVRVTSNEGALTSQSTEITTLTNSIELYNVLEDVAGVPLQDVSGNQFDLQSTSAVATATSSATTALNSRVDLVDGELTSQAASLTALTGRVNDAEGDLVQLNTVDVSSTSVLVQSLLTLQAELDTEESARASGDSALDVRVTSAEGSITSQAGLITSLQSELDNSQLDITANADATSALTTRVTSAEGSISSQATDITNLTTTVGSNTTSITSSQSSIDGIHANYSVKIDNNGRIAGIGLTSTVSNSVPTSSFVVVADKFSVVDPASTASAPIVPFSVSAGLITMGANVRISGDLITTGSINADLITAGTINANRLNIDGVTLAQSGGSLVVNNGGVNTTQLAPNAATFAPAESDSTTRNYTGAGEHIVQTLVFTGGGFDCEFLADISWASTGLAPFVLLKLNGVTIDTVLAFGGQTLFVIDGATISGVNTLQLVFSAGTNEPPGGESTGVYRSYIRALELRR